MVKLGILLRSYLPIELALELSQEAERRGYHSVWVTEGMDAKDAFTQMTAHAMKTQRIRVGSGIVPIYSRTPVLTGMTMMGLEEISGGRAILGLGASHPFIVEGGHGLKLERPLARMKEYIEIVRRVAQEPEFSYHGEVFDIPRYVAYSRALFAPGPVHVPIFIAALRSRMLRLGGSTADGVLMNLATPDYLRRAGNIVREAARDAGRDPNSVTVASIVGASVSQDEAAAEGALRLAVARYPTLMPFYNRMLRESGFASEMDEIAMEVVQGDFEGSAWKVPDSLVRALGVYGSPEHCRQGLKPFEEAGADLLVLMPYVPEGADTGQAIGDLIQAFAPS